MRQPAFGYPSPLYPLHRQAKEKHKIWAISKIKILVHPLRVTGTCAVFFVKGTQLRPCFLHSTDTLMMALQPCISGHINSNVFLKQTKIFRVYDDGDDNDRDVNSYKIDGYCTSRDHRFLKNMRLHGLTTWSGLVPEELRVKALKVLKPFVNQLIRAYDRLDDEFCDIDQEEMNIVRMPRIGRGKHNIHFDPQFSEQHKVLAELATESHFADVLTAYMQAPCSIRESGVTMTRPYDSTIQHRVQPVEAYRKPAGSEPFGESLDSPVDEVVDLAAGEGMEWHSDGPRGEATILLALEDVSPEQGCLRVIPGSHKIYVEGVGHTETFLRAHEAQMQREMVSYAYRAGQPMIIDARTLHSVSPNVSDKWRVVVWYIFDSF